MKVAVNFKQFIVIKTKTYQLKVKRGSKVRGRGNFEKLALTKNKRHARIDHVL